MKFLKQKSISKYSPNDDSIIAYDVRGKNHTGDGGRVIMDMTGGLRLPKGTTNQRPQLTGLRTPNGSNGYIRYNTDTNSIEAYVDSGWQVVSSPAVTSITKQTLGPGDYVETIFGPLTIIPPSENSIIVLVENVFQISDTNFNLLYDHLAPGDCYIEFTEAVPLDKNITIYYGFST